MENKRNRDFRYHWVHSEVLIWRESSGWFLFFCSYWRTSMWKTFAEQAHVSQTMEGPPLWCLSVQGRWANEHPPSMMWALQTQWVALWHLVRPGLGPTERRALLATEMKRGVGRWWRRETWFLRVFKDLVNIGVRGHGSFQYWGSVCYCGIGDPLCLGLSLRNSHEHKIIRGTFEGNEWESVRFFWFPALCQALHQVVKITQKWLRHSLCLWTSHCAVTLSLLCVP